MSRQARCERRPWYTTCRVVSALWQTDGSASNRDKVPAAKTCKLADMLLWKSLGSASALARQHYDWRQSRGAVYKSLEDTGEAKKGK